MPPIIYPVGTWLLGKMVYSTYVCAQVTGYNDKKTIMNVYTAPHQFCSITKRKACWSENNQCWRYKTDGRWYVSLSDKRLVNTEQLLLTFLKEHSEPTFREIYDSVLADFEVLQFVMRPLLAEKRIEWVDEADIGKWSKQSAKFRLAN